MSINWNKIRQNVGLVTSGDNTNTQTKTAEKSNINWENVRTKLNIVEKEQKAKDPIQKKLTDKQKRTEEAKNLLNLMINSGQAQTSTKDIVLDNKKSANSMTFKVGEGLDNKVDVLPGPRKENSYIDAYKRGDVPNVTLEPEKAPVSEAAIANAVVKKEAEVPLKIQLNKPEQVARAFAFLPSELARFAIKSASELAGYDINVVPATQKELILLGNDPIKKLSEQSITSQITEKTLEDAGFSKEFSKNTGVASALIVGAIIENPFILGVGKSAKALLKKAMTKMIEEETGEKVGKEVVKKIALEAENILKIADKAEREKAINNFVIKETKSLDQPKLDFDKIRKDNNITQPITDTPKKAQIIDPDTFKAQYNDFAPINHKKYSKMANEAFNEALTTNKNPIVKLTAGGPGSGKTEMIIRDIEKNFDGIIYDGTLADYDKAINKIKQATNAKKEVEINAILPRIGSAWKWSQKRALTTGREVPIKVFIKKHVDYISTLKRLVNDYPDLKIRLKDTRNVFKLADAKIAPFITNKQQILDILDSLDYDVNKLYKSLKNVKISNKAKREAIAARTSQNTGAIRKGNGGTKQILGGTPGTSNKLVKGSRTDSGLNKNLDNLKVPAKDKAGFVLSKDLFKKGAQWPDQRRLKFRTSKEVISFMDKHVKGLSDEGFIFLSKEGEQLLKQEEKAMNKKIAYQTERQMNKEVDLEGELGNQFDSFKTVLNKLFGSKKKFIESVDDYDLLVKRAANKGILPKNIDNLFYSQKHSSDEVLEIFREQARKELMEKGVIKSEKRLEFESVKEYLNRVKTVNKAVESQDKKAAYETRKKITDMTKSKSENGIVIEKSKVINSDYKAIKAKYGVTEISKATKQQLDNIHGDMQKIGKYELSGDRSRIPKYLSQDQVEVLKELNPKLSDYEANMTRKEALEKYGYVVPPKVKGNIHAPVLHLEDWKDKKIGLSYGRETMERNLEDIAGKEAKKTKEFLTDHIKEKETDRIKWLKQEKKEVKEMSAKFNIKPRSKDDSLVQIFGEGNLKQSVYDEEINKILKKNGLKYRNLKIGALNNWENKLYKFKNTDDLRYLVNSALGGVDVSKEVKKLSKELQEKFAKVIKEVDEVRAKFNWTDELELLKQQTDNWKNVKEASDFFRKKYDTLLDVINREITKYGYEPIPKRKNYFRHFQEINAWAEFLGMDKFMKLLQSEELPMKLAGQTEFFKPGKPFSTVQMVRKGLKTDYSAMVGMENWLEAASRQIYHTESLQRIRAMEKYVDVSDIPEGRIKLGNFKQYLAEYADSVAGKKQVIDRWVEKRLGRWAFTALDYVNRKTGMNMIAGNLSSVLMQFIPFSQSLATTSKKAAFKGLSEALAAPLKKKIGIIDGIESKFLTRRFGSEVEVGKIAPTKLEKGVDKAMWIFQTVDQFCAQSIVAGKYYENLGKGMAKKAAMKEADEYAAKLMANRSIGEMPTLFTEKAFKPITQFQLEVNNLYSFLAKDIPRMGDLGKKRSKKVMGAYLQFALYSYLFNSAYKKVLGRRPTFDPVQYGLILAGFDKDTEHMDIKDKGLKVASEIKDQVPFWGGRYPVEAAIPQGLSTSELSKPFAYLLAPFAGGQIKKTVEGIKAYIDGELKTKTGRTKYEVEKNPINFLRMVAFGKYATPEAQPYFTKQNELYDMLDQQYKDSAKLYVEAEDIVSKYEKMTLDEKRTDYLKTQKENPLLADKIKTLLKEKQLGLTQIDRSLKQLGVKNWNRATQIYKYLKEIKNTEKRQKYYKELVDKKVITKQVDKQIRELFNN